jgi:Cu-processing system permease protein
VRTGTLLAIEGKGAFGAATLALLRFTQGPAGAAALVVASIAFWIVAPAALAAWRLRNTDI